MRRVIATYATRRGRCKNPRQNRQRRVLHPCSYKLETQAICTRWLSIQPSRAAHSGQQMPEEEYVNSIRPYLLPPRFTCWLTTAGESFIIATLPTVTGFRAYQR